MRFSIASRAMALVATMIVGTSCAIKADMQAKTTPVEKPSLIATPTATSANPHADDERLGRHILTNMEIVKSPLSPLMRQATAQFLVAVADNVFDRYEDKENWVVVLGNESRFDNSSVSPTGAVGVGQLIPSFARDFARSCGIENFKPGDEKDFMVNATLSACFFRDLLETVPNHSVTLALGAYNSGLYSGTVQDLQHLHNVNFETANYIARFTYVKEKLDEVKTTTKKASHKYHD